MGKISMNYQLIVMFSELRYWHGNEPCHQIAYLYNYVGEPWKTQKLVCHIRNTEYVNAPGGLSGNDDAGQMSAWYVFSAMGFYPVCPGNPYYVIGSPAFEKMTIRLENGKEFVVKAHVEKGRFMLNGSPYYYIGTNFWYGAILGSEGEGGNRARLNKELDYLKSIGINNLRVLVGADGENGIRSKVEPTLQKSPGVYNDTILAGLDYLLYQMGKRKMYAVLYLNNSCNETLYFIYMIKKC